MNRRTIAVDLGEKRIGIALSDPRGRVALPHETLERTDDRNAIRYLSELVRREDVARLIVGEPRNLDGSRGPAALRASRFADKLASATGLACELIDESLTSREAEERLRLAGIDPRRSPEKVDAMAAQILLQEALDGERVTE